MTDFVDDPFPTIPTNEPPQPERRDRGTLDVLLELKAGVEYAVEFQCHGDADRVISQLELARELLQEALSHFGEEEPPIELARPSSVVKMNKSQLLDLARDTINERADQYGPAQAFFGRVASVWSAFLGFPIQAEQVAQLMVAFKLCRLTVSSAHVDSWADIAGYSALGCELATRGAA